MPWPTCGLRVAACYSVDLAGEPLLDVLAEPFVDGKLSVMRRVMSSAFHCATDARYSSFPPRVAALRRNSRETVAGSRPILRAISRTPAPWAVFAFLKRQIAARERDDHEGRHAATLAEPQRLPAACDAPTATAASSLVSPLAISRQNNRSTSRRSDGFPGDFIGALPVSAFIHPSGLPINISKIEVLR
jgi:hypothetical protein